MEIFLGTHFGTLLWLSLPETNYKNDPKPQVLSTFAIWGDFLRVLFRTFREVLENNFSEPMLWKHYCYSVCAKTYSEIRKLGSRIEAPMCRNTTCPRALKHYKYSSLSVGDPEIRHQVSPQNSSFQVPGDLPGDPFLGSHFSEFSGSPTLRLLYL